MAFDFAGSGGMNKEGESNTTKAVQQLVWIVVVSKPGQERRAKHELANQRFEVYLPMKLYEAASGPKKGQLLAAPFFKGYLFARVPVSLADWREIFSTYGVAGVLGYSQARAYGVKDVFIQRIRDQEEGGFIKLGLPDDVAPLRAGQRVACDELGVEGVFEQMLNERVDEKRCSFLVSAMGRDSRVSVDLRKLRACD